MNEAKNISRREFMGRSFGWGLWALLLYPFIKYQSTINKQYSPNVSQRTASWSKKLAG